MARLRLIFSLFMIFGFLAVALVELGGVIAAGIWVVTESDSMAALKPIVFGVIALVSAVGAALWSALRAGRGEPEGVAVHPDQAPQLWAQVRELAQVAGTRPPDEIRVVPEVNAAVTETSRLFGIIPGTRYLYLGLPLLYGMNVSQLRSVLGHELGHFSGNHTRLGGVAVRGRIAVEETVARLGTRNPLVWPFRGWAYLYRLVDTAVSRQQEHEADTLSVAVAGRETAGSALRELRVIGVAWDYFLGRWVGPGVEAGLVPQNLFGAFGELLVARADDFAEVRAANTGHEVRSAWSTHPSLSERITHIATIPDVSIRLDTRPATDLIASTETVGVALQRTLPALHGKKQLPWADFVTATVTAGLQETADSIFRQVGRITGDRNAGLGTVLSLVEANRVGEMAEPLFPKSTRKEAREQFHKPLGALIALAAIRGGKASLRRAWTGEVTLVDAAEQPISFDEVAKLAADPQTLLDARKRLAEMGIEIELSAVVETTATARGADVIGGIGNVKINKVSHDLLILDTGLLMLAGAGDSDEGNKRMAAALRSAPIEVLAQRNRYVPYEEIQSVTFDKEVPVRATITLHGGTTIALHETWTGDQLTDTSRDALVSALRQAATN